jgi:hypothetical protein
MCGEIGGRRGKKRRGLVEPFLSLCLCLPGANDRVHLVSRVGTGCKRSIPRCDADYQIAALRIAMRAIRCQHCPHLDVVRALLQPSTMPLTLLCAPRCAPRGLRLSRRRRLLLPADAASSSGVRIGRSRCRTGARARK